MLAQNDSVTQSSPTTTESEFYLNGRRLNLTTSCSVAMRAQTPDKNTHFLNYPCEVMQDQLRKCYKIILSDAFIQVEDKITLDSTYRIFQKQQSKNHNAREGLFDKMERFKRKNKKMVLFKSSLQSEKGARVRNDKKNIAKNVVNAFLKYVRENYSEDDANARNVVQAVTHLIETLKYNNQLITAIVEQATQREYFKQFLASYAPSWIQQSKIKTKQVYDQAIKIYEKLCDDRQRDMSNQNKVSPALGKDSSNNSICFRQLENYELEQQIRGFK